VYIGWKSKAAAVLPQPRPLSITGISVPSVVSALEAVLLGAGDPAAILAIIKKIESDHNFSDDENKDRSENRLEQAVSHLAKGMVLSSLHFCFLLC
jgi:hypothetical protein